MQMFLITPLIIWPMWKFPKFGLGIAGVLTTAGVILKFEIIPSVLWYPATGVAFGLAWAKDYPPSPAIQGFSPSDYFTEYYAMPWCRYQPYILGMVFGFWLQKYRNLEKLKLNSIVITWCWVRRLMPVKSVELAIWFIHSRPLLLLLAAWSFMELIHGLQIQLMKVLCMTTTKSP